MQSTELKWHESTYSNSEGGACVEMSWDWRKSTYSDDSGGNCLEAAAKWRKSAYSDSEGGNCVEVAPAWRKSTYSDAEGASCVEVAHQELTGIHIRDSKCPAGPRLFVSGTAWSAFVSTVRPEA
ncbi:DUF397 domain-containing protein [Streptomyces longispororuber]|uniref:DUF397 domain-containing protein n=1 Tax=Streptomyces longispororuber TaxID=68230 RepID=UPI001E2DFC11|nr:DUF397 domain-containing protein [Streptomyces longispororuber]